MCRFEYMLYKLEILDHKARERQGLIGPSLGASTPVVLSKDNALEVFYLLPFCLLVLWHHLLQLFTYCILTTFGWARLTLVLALDRLCSDFMQAESDVVLPFLQVFKNQPYRPAVIGGVYDYWYEKVSISFLLHVF